MASAATRKATATARTRSAPGSVNAAPAASADTTLRITRPRTSSIPAPAGIPRTALARGRIPGTTPPSRAGWPRRSNSPAAIFAATSITASSVKKRATSPWPAAPRSSGTAAASAHPRALEGLRRLGMEVEGMVEQREADGLAVLGLDHDFARRDTPHDPDLLRLGRQTDLLGGGLNATANGAVVERRGERCFRPHLVEQTVVAEEHLADVDPVVEHRHEQEQREQAAGRARTGTPETRSQAPHHCDCAPSTRSLTSLSSASLRPLASWGGCYSPTLVSPCRCHNVLPSF